MRFGETIIAIVALLLLTATAGAFVTDLETSIDIDETGKELSFLVENKSNIKQPLTINYDFPSEFTVIQQPSFVRANSKDEVKVKIFPNESLVGTTYNSMISIKVGTNKAEKNITLNYLNTNVCTINVDVNFENKRFIVEFENESFKEKSIKLTNITGIPSNWEINEFDTTVLGNTTKTIELEIENISPFTGEIEFTFDCKGTQITKTTNVEYEEPGIGIGFAGFAVLEEGFNFEFLFDILLALVATVLLVTFIARLVKVLNQKEKQTKIEVDK